MADRFKVWSSGGGVQSTAIAALIVRGVIPKPDLCVIADTGYEASTTWEYMNSVTAPALEKVGITLHRVKSEQYRTVGMYSSKGAILIPAFTTDTGKVGKLPTYCSNEWKGRVIQRFVKTQTDAKSFSFVMGMSMDELKRVKQITGKWEYEYPLIKLRMNRQDCLCLVDKMGWPEPPRSSCWLCPNRGTAEWQYLKDTSPQDFRQAVDFELAMQEKDEDLWLTQSEKPLSELVSAAGMFTGRCDSGFCFV
jgi:hypothetical protein